MKGLEGDDDEPCDIVGKGEVRINLSNGTVLRLKDVRHVPNLRRSIISVGQFSESGMKTTFTRDSWKVTKGALVVAQGKNEGTLYVASGVNSSIDVASSTVDTSTWHRRLGHTSEKGLQGFRKV